MGLFIPHKLLFSYDGNKAFNTNISNSSNNSSSNNNNKRGGSVWVRHSLYGKIALCQPPKGLPESLGCDLFAQPSPLPLV